MRFINYIKSWIAKKNNQSEQLNENSIDNLDDNHNNKTSLGFFVVNINPDLSIDLQCSWDNYNQTEEIAYVFGNMLKSLTTGQYDQVILESLYNYAVNNLSTEPKFIHKIISTWKDKEFDKLQQEMNSVPVVNPLQTFGESNIRGPQ